MGVWPRWVEGGLAMAGRVDRREGGAGRGDVDGGVLVGGGAGTRLGTGGRSSEAGRSTAAMGTSVDRSVVGVGESAGMTALGRIDSALGRNDTAGAAERVGG